MDAMKEFRAKVYFLKPEEGGRTRPIYSGYRPAFHFKLHGGDDEKVYHHCMLTLEDRDAALPGEECYSRIRLWYPELPRELLKPHAAFELSELARVVGAGTVIELYSNAPAPRPLST